MKTIKVQLHYKSFLLKLFPQWVAGFTLGRHIFVREASLSPVLLNHELIHVCQYQDKGIFGFLYQYLWKERKLAYEKKTAEIEAYSFQHNLQYTQVRWPNYKLELK